MKGAICALLPVLLAGCGGDDNGGTTAMDAGQKDASMGGDTGGQDVSTNDTGNQDTGSQDSGGGDAGNDGSNEDASDGACPASWDMTPANDPFMNDAGGVLMHTAGVGTQDYTCMAVTTDAGTTYAWTFVGPEANLNDCNAVLVGHHFASDAGATRPQWQTLDGTYVIGAKKGAFDAGSESVPWLQLQGVAWGGDGGLSQAQWIQRLNTDGGVAPSATCDQNSVGTTQKVPYTADYYFFGP